MLEKIFIEIYDKYKLNFYKDIFKGFSGKYGEKGSSLTITESFTLEVIDSLNKPTITELSEYLGISQPNTTYKVNELISKGYVKKEKDSKDKRMVRLEATDRFKSYYEKKNEYIYTVVSRMKEKFTKEEINEFERILSTISNELMPEVSRIKK